MFAAGHYINVVHNTRDLWLWIPGSGRSLSSGRPEAGPGGPAPE